MRLKIRPEDVNALEMSDWLARLRDEVSGETGGDETELESDAPAQQLTRPPTSTTAFATATPGSRPSTGATTGVGREQATTGVGREQTVRAVIGNELHMPIVWCEMGSCISYHTDPAALGEADIRTRALRAGWRLDRFGRLACVDCLQSSSWFRTAYPVVLWDREIAATAVSMMAARRCEDGAGCSTAGMLAAANPTAESVTSIPAGQWMHGRHRKQPT
jgi:hypothetical protein